MQMSGLTLKMSLKQSDFKNEIIAYNASVSRLATTFLHWMSF